MMIVCHGLMIVLESDGNIVFGSVSDVEKCLIVKSAGLLLVNATNAIQDQRR